MLPLKWTERTTLKIGNLYIGEVMYHGDLRQARYSAWFSSGSLPEIVGLFSTQEEAKEAVEKKYYAAVGVSDGAR